MTRPLIYAWFGALVGACSPPSISDNMSLDPIPTGCPSPHRDLLAPSDWRHAIAADPKVAEGYSGLVAIVTDRQNQHRPVPGVFVRVAADSSPSRSVYGAVTRSD